MKSHMIGIIKEPTFGSESSTGILSFLGGLVVGIVGLMIYKNPSKYITPGSLFPKFTGDSNMFRSAKGTLFPTTVPESVETRSYRSTSDLDWDHKWHLLGTNRFEKVASDDEGGTILSLLVEKAGVGWTWFISPEYPGDERLPNNVRKVIQGNATSLAAAKKAVESRL